MRVVAAEKRDVDAERLVVERVEVRTERPRTAAVRTAQRERDALHRRALRVGHLGERLRVRVQIDEAGRDDQSARVDRALRERRRDRPALDAYDVIARDGDVAAIARRSGAVDDRAVRDEQIVLAGLRAIATRARAPMRRRRPVSEPPLHRRACDYRPRLCGSRVTCRVRNPPGRRRPRPSLCRRVGSVS